MPLPNMTPQQFLSAAQTVIERAPGAELVKNEVGNLAIVSTSDEYLGFVDLRNGEVTWADGWRRGAEANPVPSCRQEGWCEMPPAYAYLSGAEETCPCGLRLLVMSDPMFGHRWAHAVTDENSSSAS